MGARRMGIQCHLEKFKSTIDITSQPRDTLLADVTILLSNMHIPMHALVAKESKDHSVILIQSQWRSTV